MSARIRFSHRRAHIGVIGNGFVWCFVWCVHECYSQGYSQDMCYRWMKGTCIELRTCMSSYRCHRPGNASDRARMKTFSFRLGDLFVSSGRLGWKWFRLMMKRLGNRARMKGTCIELRTCMSSYRCHRPGNASSSDEVYMYRAQDMYELISVS